MSWLQWKIETIQVYILLLIVEIAYVCGYDDGNY